jgi:hypothetical protein
MDDENYVPKTWNEVIHGDGGHCPVCQRWGKVYVRNINQTMARSLIWLCRTWLANQPKEWVDVPNTAPRSVIRTNQLPTLAWWGLVERCQRNDNNKTKYSGLWRPTQKGWDFFNGTVKVPHKVYTYNNMVQKYGGNDVFIHECFETNFNYQEVMQSNFDD